MRPGECQCAGCWFGRFVVAAALAALLGLLHRR